MSLGMFSAIALPRRPWDEACLRYMLPCLPLVGAVVGALWLCAARLLALCGIHPALAAAGLALCPFALTGFLHLDGYMDTSDALLSGRPPAEKLRILKDPHTGAFAVIMLAALFLLQYASAYAFADSGRSASALLAIPVISRVPASLSMLYMTPLPQSSYAPMLAADKRPSHAVFIIILAAAALTASYPLAGAAAVACAAVAGLCGLLAILRLRRVFGGISGDLAGFSISVAELCGLITLAVF